MAGAPPQIPPPMVPGMTAGPAPGGGMGPMMPPPPPPDNLDQAIAGLKNRRGSATEILRQVVSMLETAAGLDPSMKDRIGAALACLRGPNRPGAKPDTDY